MIYKFNNLTGNKVFFAEHFHPARVKTKFSDAFYRHLRIMGYIFISLRLPPF